MNFASKWNKFLLSELNKPKKENVERLAVFDFDGTLFRSPDAPDDFKGNWHASKESLGPPNIDKIPDKSFWFKDVVTKAEEAFNDPKTFSIMLTGRIKRNFEDRILELLEQNGIQFNYIEMNNSGQESTDFKIGEIKKILKKYPRISLIEFWDDKKEYLKKYKKEFTEDQVTVRTHKVAQTIEESLLLEQDYFDTESIPRELLKKLVEKGIEMPPQIFTSNGLDVIDFKFELYDKPPPLGLGNPTLKDKVKFGKFAVPFPPRDSSPKAYLLFNGGPGLVDLEDVVDEAPSDRPILPYNWIDPIINKDIATLKKNKEEKKEEDLISETQSLLKEIFKRGRTYVGNRNVAAFRSKVWSFRDRISKRMAKEMVKDIGLTTNPLNIVDYMSLKDAVESEDKYDVLLGGIIGDELELDTISPSFRRDPRSSVAVRKIVQAFNLKSVNYQATDDDLVTIEKEKVGGKIPDHVYHGTSTKYLRSILSTGLRPNVSPTNYKDVTHEDAVFFTSKIDEAAMHAEDAVYKIGGDPVVLIMRIPDPAKLKPDYDVDAHAEDTHYPNIPKKVDNAGKLRGKSASWSRELGIHGYRGRIPPSFIDELMIVPGFEDKIGSETVSLKDFKKVSKGQALMYLENMENYGIPSFEKVEPEDEEENN